MGNSMTVNDYSTHPNEELPKNWNAANFSETILHQRVDVGNIKKQNYMETGKFPIIDQSQDYIVGYSNDETLVYDGELPIIIFGDHTRIFKFIDFPFICGADGTKVLQPNQEIVNPEYFYFALKSLNIPSKGYNRHYRLLKEQKIPIPPLPEQRAIASVLSTVRQAIEATEGVIATARELKRSMMKHLFTYGPVPVDQADKIELKKTEFGEVPKKWDVISIKDLGEVITGSTPNTKEEKYYGGKYRLISPANLNENPYVDSAHRWLTEEGLEQSRVLPKDTVLVSCIGYIGKTGITKDEQSATNQQINAVVCNEDSYPKFVYHALTNLQKYLENRARITTVPILNKTNFQNLKVTRPSYDVQLEIANILDAIVMKIKYETDVKSMLEELFHSLLHHLMSGKVRVSYEQ